VAPAIDAYFNSAYCSQGWGRLFLNDYAMLGVIRGVMTLFIDFAVPLCSNGYA